MKVFRITNTEGKACTATLIRRQSLACHLVTNAHCIATSNSSITMEKWFSEMDVSAEVSSLYARIPKPIQTMVKKVDASKDLAELVLPEEIAQEFCLSIASSETPYDDLKSLNSFASIGFHSQFPVNSFTQQLDWTRGHGLEKLETINTSLQGLEFLFHLGRMRMFTGMSGGPTITQNFELVGLNVRLVAFQGQMEIIPLRDVFTFINDESLPAGVVLSSGSNNSLNAGENSGGNGGENSGGNGGENSGGNGGENSGGNGGENSGGNGGENSGGNGGDIPFKQDTNPLLRFLREADEGVAQKQADGSWDRLLGMGPYQIDGKDDIRRLKDQKLRPLLRGSRDFKKLRPDFFNRIKGVYRLTQDYPHATSDILLQGRDEWKTVMSGSPAIQLEVKRLSRTKAVISLYVSEFRISELAQSINVRKFPVEARQDVYTALMSADAQTIELKSATGQSLHCKNIYFLKLICSSLPPSTPEEFSLSLSVNGPAVTKIRQSKLNANDYAEYLYGTLVRMKK